MPAVFSWEHVKFLYVWEFYAVFSYICLLKSGWQLGVGFGVSQRGSSFCSFAEVDPVVLKHHVRIPVLDFACVPSYAARNSL